MRKALWLGILCGLYQFSGEDLELMETVGVRLAPSSAGNVHLGILRTAPLKGLFARPYGVTLILLNEDTTPDMVYLIARFCRRRMNLCLGCRGSRGGSQEHKLTLAKA